MLARNYLFLHAHRKVLRETSRRVADNKESKDAPCLEIALTVSLDRPERVRATARSGAPTSLAAIDPNRSARSEPLFGNGRD